MHRNRLDQFIALNSVSSLSQKSLADPAQKDGKYRDLQDFNKQVAEMNNTLDEIESYLKEMSSIHHLILAATFATNDNQIHLEYVMAKVKENAKVMQGYLKDVERAVDKLTVSNLSHTAACRIRKVQHDTISRRFMDIMKRYNQIQTQYRDDCKKRIKRQLEITGRMTTEDEIEDMIESGNPRIFTEGVVVQTERAEKSLIDIQARHRDIQKLEKNILELHDMFLNMAILVENQGLIIDRIEDNVMGAKDYVESGAKNIKIAREYQKKAQKTQLCICLICFIIILFAVLLIVFTFIV